MKIEVQDDLIQKADARPMQHKAHSIKEIAKADHLRASFSHTSEVDSYLSVPTSGAGSARPGVCARKLLYDIVSIHFAQSWKVRVVDAELDSCQLGRPGAGR